jgi:hypothetical protein
MTPAPPITQASEPVTYSCSLCDVTDLNAIDLVRHIRCFHDVGISEAVKLSNEIKSSAAGPPGIH